MAAAGAFVGPHTRADEDIHLRVTMAAVAGETIPVTLRLFMFGQAEFSGAGSLAVNGFGVLERIDVY